MEKKTRRENKRRESCKQKGRGELQIKEWEKKTRERLKEWKAVNKKEEKNYRQTKRKRITDKSVGEMEKKEPENGQRKVWETKTREEIKSCERKSISRKRKQKEENKG